MLCLATSGCTHFPAPWSDVDYLSIASNADSKENLGTLFVWDSTVSAAILLPNKTACMQTALALKTTNVKAEAALSNALIELTKSAKTVVDSGDSGTEKSDAMNKASASVTQAAKLLTTTTERTAFLNMGMFYICQIAANGSINQSETNQIMLTLITESAGIKSGVSEPETKIAAPAAPSTPAAKANSLASQSN